MTLVASFVFFFSFFSPNQFQQIQQIQRNGFVNFVYSYNDWNVTTQVNVTNAGPDILNISVNGNLNVTLNAGSTYTLTCNASLRDYNGFNDIDVVNATLYFFRNTSGQSDDRNEHYTNVSCEERENDGSFLVNYTCTFEVYYFANNGSWYCNVTANDSYNFGGSLNKSFFINPLYALNVTDMIDYGNLSVYDYSDNETATVTNYGNRPMNISVLGFGTVLGDGVGLVCTQGSNISVGNQRFYKSAQDWAIKIPLGATNRDMNVTLPQQQDEVTQIIQDTFWQLYVSPNPYGLCSGKIRFTATAP